MYNKPEVEKYSQNVDKLTFPDGKELYLVGTAHVSAESVELVKKTIEEVEPDTIAIELDEGRYNAINDESKYKELDIIQIIKKGQTFFFIGKLILGVFQKKVSEKTGSRPGQEFITASEIAKERDIKLALVDRDVGVTLKRAWRINRFMGKMKIIFSLLFSSKGTDSIDTKDIEQLKTADALAEMIEQMGDQMPLVKKVIIDERDTYLTGKIQQNLGEKTVAVVGAGHVPGMLKNFEEEITEETLEEITTVPPKTFVSKLIPWVIPLAILSLFGWGFYNADFDVAKDAIIYWVLINGVLSALGALIALGHPITVLSAFIAAPITSLNPTIGAGFVTGLVQAFVTPPKVKDFESLQEDAMKLKGWWRNRLTRLLLVFLLSSVGSAIGTFIAFPVLTKIFV